MTAPHHGAMLLGERDAGAVLRRIAEDATGLCGTDDKAPPQAPQEAP